MPSPLPATPPHPDITALLAARRYCRIAHHVPGRLRLRFDPLGLTAALGGRLAALDAALARVAGIERTELNVTACSLVIHYDTRRLEAASWDRLLTGSEAAAIAVLEAALPPA